jgi:hypothetical protein
MSTTTANHGAEMPLKVIVDGQESGNEFAFISQDLKSPFEAEGPPHPGFPRTMEFQSVKQ